MNTEHVVSDELRRTLASHAESADREASWPAVSWQALCRAGVTAWGIPAVYGGQQRDAIELLDGYETLAGACLTTAFILSQRESACRRLLASPNEWARSELLPSLARGESFATVGLSQLTTSRQHGAPALVARRTANGWVLDGSMPWVTGAAQADQIVTGAVLEDGRQLLAVMPRRLPGVSAGPPLDLMALRGSLTAELRCDRVHVEERWLLAGPAEAVLGGGRGGTGGVETSCLALGLVGAALEFLASEGAARPEWRATAQRLGAVRDQLRHDMRALALGESASESLARLRARANALVLRATQAALMAAKGAGFLHPHPAQRWARQAHFFLVWSCPRPATEATLQFLVADEPCG